MSDPHHQSVRRRRRATPRQLELWADLRASGTWLNGTRVWTAAEDAELGTAPDGVVAVRIGRSRSAVKRRRNELGVRRYAAPRPPPPEKDRRGTPRARWTAAEDEVVRSRPTEEAASRLGRTLAAVRSRRVTLGVARQCVPFDGAAALRARVRAGLSRAALARRAGVLVVTLRNVEVGTQTRIAADVAGRLTLALAAIARPGPTAVRGLIANG